MCYSLFACDLIHSQQTLCSIDLYNVPGYTPLQQSSNDDELVFGCLLIHLQQLYASKDSHVKQSGLEADLVAMHTESKQDPKHGNMLQTASSMAVPFSVQQTNAVIWDGLVNAYKRVSSISTNAYVSSPAAELCACVLGSNMRGCVQ